MDIERIQALLQKEDIITGSDIKTTPLKGGVSSDILVVSDSEYSVVVKQALEKLNVEDDWFADVSRNKNEQKFIRFLESVSPGSTPKLLYSNQEHSFFAMEYLGKGFKNWKQELLKGMFDPSIAIKAAELLATIHRESRMDHSLKKQFNKGENFYELRTDPYLVTTGKRHPDLKDIFLDEVARLKKHQETLVHGDFSPKNILVNNKRVVLLDHEVAWFGDPAFDLAFFLNHLYLKMLYHFKRQQEIQDLTSITWETYFNNMEPGRMEEMEKRTIRLLLMLMLARVDGKSPVEYLDLDQQTFVKGFVKKELLAGSFTQQEINQKWKTGLKREYSED